MSAASPTPQVRRTAAPAPRAPQQATPAAHTATGRHGAYSRFVLAEADDPEDHIRLNLSDIPRLPGTLEVESLKPSLLSRLFDLVSPLDKR